VERDHQGDEASRVTIGSRIAGLLRRVAPVSPPGRAVAALPPPERWADQFGSAAARTSWVTARRDGGRLYADLPADRVTALRERCPDIAAALIAQADRLMRHEFNLLGSGPYTPVDPDRARDGAYAPIDWALDPIARLRFPAGFPHSSWTPQMRPGLADIKLPWELGRCQHWVTLGQAFRLSGDERYAEEIVRQHADFLAVNPIGVGVQYVCTMDVAIRAVNWAIAFELIRTSGHFGAAAEDAYRSLFDTGVFVERNLENTYEVTSNHFLSNVVGVYALGIVFADLPAGKRWARQGREWLEQEMRVQVLPDGGDYESSVPYHRLVTELFASGMRLAQLDRAPLSDAYLSSLRRMCAFHADVMRPDGLLPQIGDADDGRLHVFSEYGTWNPQDGRHLLAVAACLHENWEWLAGAGEHGEWEAAWWGFTPPATSRTVPVAGTLAEYRDFGILVARGDGSYLAVTNGRVGTNGFGNHKHNDLLSFEFHDGGRPLVVDPGSYVYTSDPDARNAFRSTRTHNTLCIDGVEQNDLKPEYLFRLFETSTVEHVRAALGPDVVEYVGRHTGYARLAMPVVHERTLRLAMATGSLTIVDRLDGSGRHALTWHFHLAPGVTIRPAGAGVCALDAGGHRWRLSADPALTPSIVDAWYSPSYGVRVPCKALDLSATHDVAANRTYRFAIEREARG
jgi:hypothetical protein